MLGNFEFSFSATFENSQLVCLLPVGILTMLRSFTLFVSSFVSTCFHVLPLGEWSVKKLILILMFPILHVSSRPYPSHEAMRADDEVSLKSYMLHPLWCNDIFTASEFARPRLTKHTGKAIDIVLFANNFSVWICTRESVLKHWGFWQEWKTRSSFLDCNLDLSFCVVFFISYRIAKTKSWRATFGSDRYCCY